jgi:hypothetical protein
MNRELAISTVLLLTLAACGADDEESASTDTAPATGVPATDPPKQTDAPVETDPPVVTDAPVETDLPLDLTWPLVSVDPVLRTSHSDEPKSPEFFAELQGPVRELTDFGIASILSDANIEQISAEFAPGADVVFAPTAELASTDENVLVLAFRIAADLTDPAECEGNLLNLVANINQPDFGETYPGNEAFPGEYYVGGNVFVNFSLVDCQVQHFADAYSGGSIVNGLIDPSVAFLAVDDGATYGLIVLPSEYIHPEGTARFIFFEHPEGENFLPENTRYQSWTDTFDPAFPTGDVSVIGIEDLMLVPATD